MKLGEVWIKETLFWLNILNLILLFAYGASSLISGIIDFVILGWFILDWTFMFVWWQFLGGIILLLLGVLYLSFPFRTLLGILREKEGTPRTAITQNRDVAIWVLIIGLVGWICGGGMWWGRFWLGASFVVTFALLLVVYYRKQL